MTRFVLRSRPYVCLPCNEFFQTKNELTLHTASHSSKENDQDQSANDTDSGSSSSSSDKDKKAPGSMEGNESGGSTSSPAKINIVELPNGTKIELKNVQHGQLMSLERMRMLLAILLKRISTPSRLRRLGYGTKLIDVVLTKSIQSSGRKIAISDDSLDVRSLLKRNIEILLDWTIPKEFMDRFRQEQKTVEEILEELTS